MHVLGVESCLGGAPQADRPLQLGHLAYSIGGISFGLFGSPHMQLTLDSELLPFQVSAKNVNVCMNAAWIDSLELPSEAPLFHSGGVWLLFEERDGYRFYFTTPFLGASPYKTAWFDRDFRRGEVMLVRRYYDSCSPVNALEYPLDELLAIQRLSLGEGVEVHALGVVDEFEQGRLFIGHSGAGKSTLARLWQKRPGARVLSDDRIILRFQNGRVRMYGTPWHGDAGLARAESADLTAIFILQHGRNQLVALSPARSAAELLARSFIPHHSARALRFVLKFLDRVANELPCLLFGFEPDENALETIYHA